ncbi:MAG: RloB domain-containing protein, partial [Ignavibacteriaceae bacterium]|nr:RloB domain-containing protein [Ignavibacteriaceae bacterium]
MDGETEVWYLQMLKRDLQNGRTVQVSIKPEIPKRKSLAEQYKLAVGLSKQEFTKVFWIVDLDTLIKESNETPSVKISALKQFNEYRQKCEQNYRNIIIIAVNPCLEFWFLLHFINTARIFENCSEAMAQLKKYLAGYEKSQKYFTKENDDIYLKLKPHLSAAIRSSEALGSYDSRNPGKAVCEMYLLFQ